MPNDKLKEIADTLDASNLVNSGAVVGVGVIDTGRIEAYLSRALTTDEAHQLDDILGYNLAEHPVIGALSFSGSMAMPLPPSTPPQPGCRIAAGNSDGDFGTLGAVIDVGGEDYILSCGHTVEGDGTVVSINGRQIADEAQYIPFTGAISADAGVARIAPGAAVSSEFPPWLGHVVHQVGSMAPGMTVKQSGAASRGTGKIEAAPATVWLKNFGQCLRFDNTGIVSPLSPGQPLATAGDSGSLAIADADQKPAGIVFARFAEGGWVALSSLRAAIDWFETRFGATIRLR